MPKLADSIATRIRDSYIRAAMPLGRRKLQQAVTAGLALAFEEPIDFLFSRAQDEETLEVARRVEMLRAELARSAQAFHVAFGETADGRRTAQQIAYRSSVSQMWGTFLFLCARSFAARSILELGSCAGISGSYLASSPACRRFVTIEASPSLAEVAAANLHRVSQNAELINAPFDEALPDLLTTFGEGLDLVYVDGHHELEPTLHLWQRLKPHLKPGALVVFDDIRWSPGMWKAWGIIRGQEGFSCSVDVGRFGLCQWDGTSLSAAHHDFAAYTGWLRVHKTRRNAQASG